MKDNSASNKKESWLLDAEVRYKVTPVKGRWEVALVFINIKDPNHFLVRKIGDYHSQRLAEIYGMNMQRTAARDFKGTQKLNKDAHRISHN